MAQDLDRVPRRPWPALDVGYDHSTVYASLDQRDVIPDTAKRGTRTPVQTRGRWVAERTNSWMNNFGEIRRCTERRMVRVDAPNGAWSASSSSSHWPL
ncbi:hypothetical protein ACH4SK_40125 [Streptomyces inhibens]|uniref:hypothetical protein n=1 Tax=Streptomyces inhibens TaxID=2293571 RepID=UPI00379180CA